MIFRSQIPYRKPGAYAALIWPLVQLKRAFRFAYGLIQKVLWAELIQGEKLDELTNLGIFLIFCLLSLLAYYCRDYNNLVILGFFLIWFFDYQFAKHQYLHSNQQVHSSLEIRGDWVLWQTMPPYGQVKRSKFQRTEVKQISILRTQVCSGAFQEVMGATWQVYVTLADQSEFLFSEERQILAVVEKGKQLATYFNVPLRFIASEGKSDYAAEQLNIEQGNRLAPWPKTIQCQATPRQWHIYSKWGLNNSWKLFQAIAQQSGFLLFLLIMSGFMIRFGELLNFLMTLFWGKASLYPPTLNFFDLDLDWRDKAALIFAAGLMVVKGAQLSHEEHIYIDRDHLNFFIDNKKIAQLRTQEIQIILLVKEPYLAIFVLAQDKAIEIRDLQQEEEFRALLLKLEEGVMQFQRTGL